MSPPRPQHAGEIDVGEVQGLLAAVENPLARQEPVQIHLPQPDGVGLAVAAVESLIICYAPCINHGLKKGMGKTQENMADAVKCGY